MNLAKLISAPSVNEVSTLVKLNTTSDVSITSMEIVSASSNVSTFVLIFPDVEMSKVNTSPEIRSKVTSPSKSRGPL